MHGETATLLPVDEGVTVWVEETAYIRYDEEQRVVAERSYTLAPIIFVLHNGM